MVDCNEILVEGNAPAGEILLVLDRCEGNDNQTWGTKHHWLAEEIYDMLRVNNHQFKAKCRDFPVVQWLRVCASKTGGPGSNRAQETRSYMLQLKIPYAATKTWHSQINNFFLKKAKCKRQRPPWVYLVQSSRSVVSDSFQPHALQHTRFPCPSSTPRVYSNSCSLTPWCHPTISSSVVPFSRLQSFPASGSFQMSQLLTSGGQRMGVSASTADLPMNIQAWFPLGWTGWISLQSKGLSRVFSNTTVQKHQFFGTQLSL